MCISCYNIGKITATKDRFCILLKVMVGRKIFSKNSSNLKQILYFYILKLYLTVISCLFRFLKVAIFLIF